MNRLSKTEFGKNIFTSVFRIYPDSDYIKTDVLSVVLKRLYICPTVVESINVYSFNY